MQGGRISRNRLEIRTITIFVLFGIAVCWKVTELFKATDIIQNSFRQRSSVTPTCVKIVILFVFLGNKNTIMVCVYIIYTPSKHQTKPCNFITRLRIRNMAKRNNNANTFVPYTVQSVLHFALRIVCTKHRGEKNK
jgi:hypothetical protein